MLSKEQIQKHNEKVLNELTKTFIKFSQVTISTDDVHYHVSNEGRAFDTSTFYHLEDHALILRVSQRLSDRYYSWGLRRFQVIP